MWGEVHANGSSLFRMPEVTRPEAFDKQTLGLTSKLETSVARFRTLLA